MKSAANLWSDEQKSHIRQSKLGKVARQTEAQNYPKVCDVDVQIDGEKDCALT